MEISLQENWALSANAVSADQNVATLCPLREVCLAGRGQRECKKTLTSQREGSHLFHVTLGGCGCYKREV